MTKKLIIFRRKTKRHHSNKPLQVGQLRFSSITEACAYYGVNQDKFRGRLNIGWSLEEALNIKPKIKNYKEAYTGYVYVIKNKINKKVYVGITIKNIATRLKEHFYKASRNKESKNKFYNAINSIGPGNFYVSLLYKTQSLEELQEKEKYYINKYNSIEKGYNTNVGGSIGSLGAYKPIEFRGKTYNSKYDLYKLYKRTEGKVRGKIASGQTLEQALGLSKYYKCNVIIDGNIIGYNTVKELCFKYNINYSKISNAPEPSDTLIEKFLYEYDYQQRLNKFKLIQEKKPLRILSWDPGTVNSAITVTDYYKDKSPKIIHTQLIDRKNLLTSFAAEDINFQGLKFRKFMRNIHSTYKPDAFAFELFLPRKFNSNLAAPINFMIGIAVEISLSNHTPFYPVMPSQWKKRFTAICTDLEKIYDRSFPIKNRFPDHVIDSLLIGAFFIPKDYKSLKLNLWKELINQCKSIYEKDSILTPSWLKNEALKKPTPKKVKKRKKPKKPSRLKK